MNDPEVVEEINSAARLHAECMVKAVMFRVTQRTDIGLSKNTVLLSKLKQLWEDNLQTNTETTPTIEQDVTSYVGIANANKHRRLNFSVGSTIPSIYGRPAMFMDRPLYACDVLSQKTKPDGTESKRKTVKDRKKKTEPAVLESPPPIDLVENEEYDVIIGTLIQVKLGALLDKAAGRSGTEALLVNQDKWVEGRVASIVTADSSSRIRNRAGASHNPLTQVKSQLLTLKIRFRNGAELDVKWPDSAHLRTPTLTDAVTGARSAYINDSTNLSQTAPFRHAGGGDSSRSTANDNDEASNILNQVFGSLIDSDSEDEEWIGTSGLGGANASLHKGGDQALRILLGDFEFDDIAKAGGTSVDISGAGRDRGAPASVGASGCLPVRSESTSAGHGSGSSSTIGIGGGSGRRQQTVAAAVAQLATGERVSQAQLQYIEDTFIEGYRPRFRIMPAQRDCAASGWQVSSRRRNFSSRRWTDTSSATARGAVCGASNSESAAADEREEGVVAVLSAEEDPLQPLPEPEILIIGRAIKRLRRGEESWDFGLVDVYARCGGDNNNPDTHLKRPKQLLLPRCKISLNTHLIFPSNQDPYWVQNNQLLRELC